MSDIVHEIVHLSYQKPTCSDGKWKHLQPSTVHARKKNRKLKGICDVTKPKRRYVLLPVSLFFSWARAMLPKYLGCVPHVPSGYITKCIDSTQAYCCRSSSLKLRTHSHDQSICCHQSLTIVSIRSRCCCCGCGCNLALVIARP